MTDTTRRINSKTYSMPQDQSFIGFDSLFNKLNMVMTNGQYPQSQSNYPPYNIIKYNDESYIIELAVAGFAENDLDITLQDGVLTISGDAKPNQFADGEFIHRGIAARSFDRKFTLANSIEVEAARIKNGMLQIKLLNVIPESKKLKRIEIGTNKMSKEFLAE